MVFSSWSRAGVLRRCVYFGRFFEDLSDVFGFCKNIAIQIHAAGVAAANACQTYAAWAQAAQFLQN
ncbi:hypothetical protein [Comamonas terrigena]|uniref:hypothetical protein n=1 Tax=Comamonas terrigena TaxID=32013 RepID=UPI00244A001D|nr:hypothetical protein [Comamonas terrigena]MDH0048474.1 hypothetical protein [Comamonas terrigena]MDH0510882.1 hypothetical protein [Comamonas terrigena]MDH1090211.1 hypothetical protein [Comamonas terrigena]MDH1499634.1 hypothetical protein [Comamonas terrigena]